jgi:hypothetical protein
MFPADLLSLNPQARLTPITSKGGGRSPFQFTPLFSHLELRTSHLSHLPLSHPSAKAFCSLRTHQQQPCLTVMMLVCRHAYASFFLSLSGLEVVRKLRCSLFCLPLLEGHIFVPPFSRLRLTAARDLYASAKNIRLWMT